MTVSTTVLLNSVEALIAATQYATRTVLANRGTGFGGGISIATYNQLVSRKVPLENVLNGFLSDKLADPRNASAIANTISLRISTVRSLIVSVNSQLKIKTTSATSVVLKADVDSNSKVLQLLMSLESWARTQAPTK